MQRFGNDPFAEGDNFATGFGDRNEIARRDFSARGMVPAHQCLMPGYPSAIELDYRLEVDLHFSAFEGDPQVLLERLVVELCGQGGASRRLRRS